MTDQNQDFYAGVLDQWRLPVPSEQSGDRAAVLQALRERVLYLLAHDQHKLNAALYILDVSEARHIAAMKGATLEDRAEALAEAILDRETEKIQTRKKYGKGKQELID